MFTVWRPTSFDAIKKMMVGEGVGKGLEIKGKSAKCGLLSGELLLTYDMNIKMMLSQESSCFLYLIM